MMNNLKKQNGAALAVSLILLVAMTILGVATLNSTRLSERVSSNAQQKAIVFETSESVINSITASDEYEQMLLDSRTSNLEPDPVVFTDETDLINAQLDQTNTLGTSVDVSAEASIQFCLEKAKFGSDMTADESGNPNTGAEYDIRAVSNIANSKARADHVLRVSSSTPRFYSIGKCVTPGS